MIPINYFEIPTWQQQLVLGDTNDHRPPEDPAEGQEWAGSGRLQEPGWYLMWLTGIDDKATFTCGSTTLTAQGGYQELPDGRVYVKGTAQTTFYIGAATDVFVTFKIENTGAGGTSLGPWSGLALLTGPYPFDPLASSSSGSSSSSSGKSSGRSSGGSSGGSSSGRSSGRSGGKSSGGRSSSASGGRSSGTHGSGSSSGNPGSSPGKPGSSSSDSSSSESFSPESSSSESSSCCCRCHGCGILLGENGGVLVEGNALVMCTEGCSDMSGSSSYEYVCVDFDSSSEDSFDDSLSFESLDYYESSGLYESSGS